MEKRISLKEIIELENVDIRTVNKEDLVDISDLVLDNSIPHEERPAWILERVKNPFCFRVGDMAIKLEFKEDGPSLQELFTDYLKRKISGL